MERDASLTDRSREFSLKMFELCGLQNEQGQSFIHVCFMTCFPWESNPRPWRWEHSCIIAHLPAVIQQQPTNPLAKVVLICCDYQFILNSSPFCLT